MKVRISSGVDIDVDGMHGLLAALRKALGNASLREEQIAIVRKSGWYAYDGWNSIVAFSVDGYGHMGFCEDPELIKKPSVAIWDAIVAASRS